MKKKLTVVLLLWMLIFLPFFGGRAVDSLTAKADAAAAQEGKTYTVSFLLDANEPSEVYKSLTVEEGKYLDYEEIPVSPTPLKNTDYFLFWTEDGTTPFSFANPITQDVTLTAKWASKGYIVQFLVNGKVFNEQLVAEGGSAVAPGAVTVIGYTFEGWGDPSAYENVTHDLQIEAVLTVQKYTATVYAPDGWSMQITDISHGEDVDLTQIEDHPIVGYLPWDGRSIEGNTRNVQSNVSLYLVYERQTFTVRYEAPEADAWEIEEKAVVYGQTAPYSSKVPVKEGFMFVGWYVGEQAYDFTREVTQEVTLTAKFVQLAKEKHTVQFLRHDGSVYSEQLVEEDSAAIEPGAPYREGYTFLGWSGDFSSITAPTEIYPLYAINEYSVTVYFDGQVILHDKSVVYGGSVAQPNPADYQTPEGKEFLYFNGSFSDIRKNTEIHAVFRDKTYAVYFKNGNDTVGFPQTVTHGEGAFVPAAPEKRGWEFLGWALEGEEIALLPSADYTSAITEGCVFSAVYRQNTYTVSFYDGDRLVYTVENMLYGSFVPYKNLAHTDEAIFMGWYTESSCINAYEFETPITGNLTLYASWMQRPKEYFTVTFETDEGFYTSAVVEKNDTARELTAPGKEGYEFKYWMLNGEEFDFTTPITENITLVAHFEPKSYTVTFKGLDGKVLKTETVVHGSAATAPTENELKEEGYDFTGWKVSFNEVKGDLIVRASYEKKSYTVTFHNGESLSTQAVEHGGFLTIVTAQKEGHKFLGWYTQEEGGEKFSLTDPITAEVNVYARFSVNAYTLSYYYYDASGVQRCIQRSVEYGAVIDWIGEGEIENLASGRFDGWSVNGYSEPPVSMPAKSLTATAILRRTYAIEYFVGEWSKRVEVEEGTPLTTPESLQAIGYPFPEDKVVTFLGWDGSLPDVMPNHNLTLYANVQIKNYYTITYQINGQSYLEPVRVLEGEVINLIALPTQSYEEFVIHGWKNAYSVMPSQDIVIEADITLYRYLRYELNGEPFGTAQKLLPGDIIVTVLPTLQAWESFDGWQNLPDKMPDNDLVISGTTTLKKNYISVEARELGNGRVELRIYLRGDVCMAGVVGKVYFVSELRTEEKEYFSEDGLGFIYIRDEKQGNFVWSSPDNVTEEFLLISVVGEFQGRVEDLVAMVQIDQMVLITEEGEIVPTLDYEIGK